MNGNVLGTITELGIGVNTVINTLSWLLSGAN